MASGPRASGRPKVEDFPLSTAGIRAAAWQRQGRFALIWQKCLYPELLDVRVSVVRDRRAYQSTQLGHDEAFERCRQRASRLQAGRRLHPV